MRWSAHKRGSSGRVDELVVPERGRHHDAAHVGDPGEEPPDAALREAREETGLPVTLVSRDLVHVDVHPGPRGHTHLDLRYLVRAEPVDPAPAEGESQDVRWWSWDEAIAVADPGLAGVLRALRPAFGRAGPSEGPA
jgi:8-oxo-dGTP pyrophosphatase MutT (NUDIX family)